MLRDLFSDPHAALFLTIVTQWEFVTEVNALLKESLIGTEIQTAGLTSAQTREAVARGIRYRKKDGTLAISPPGRVMMLMDLVSPWVNITYRGCRYLQEARAETLRKYSVQHEYLKELNQPSIFNQSLGPEDEEYVLMSLTRSAPRTPKPPTSLWPSMAGAGYPEGPSRCRGSGSRRPH